VRSTAWSFYLPGSASRIVSWARKWPCRRRCGALYVFFVLDVGSRYVHIFSITPNPDGLWTIQQARNLLMDLGEGVEQFTFLTRDRAGAVRRNLRHRAGRRRRHRVQDPTPEPGANAFAERFVLTARSKVTDGVPIRALDLQQPPRSDRPTIDLTHRRIKRRPILGGLITEYERAA
jgi:putative transposase